MQYFTLILYDFILFFDFPINTAMKKKRDSDCWMPLGKVWKVPPFFRERYKVDMHLWENILEIYGV